MDARELTEAVKKAAFAEGADMVGVASVSRYDGAPRKLRPQAHMPEAKAVVVMAVHHPDASIDFGAEPNGNYPAGFQVGMIPKLDTMALRVSKFMEGEGYSSVPLSCTYYWRHRKIPGVPYDHAASFSHMNAFVAAGLGEYGWHGMVMSPKYGPRQRIISVITDAPLLPDPLYGGEPLCDRCKQCERACWGENYKESSLLSPSTISFAIEGKKFEYANINRWRCFWGEQCHLDMKRLAERGDLDEAGIYKALDSGVERTYAGNAGYMCSSLKFCMSKAVRKWDKSKAKNPLRKKPAPSGDWASLKEAILLKAKEAGADRIAINPVAPFEALRPKMYEGFRADDFFKSFKWVVSIGRAMPESLSRDGEKLAAKNSGAIRTLTQGRMMIGTLDIARFLDDAGHEAMQDGGLFGISDLAADISGWNIPGGPKIAVQSLLTDAPLTAFNETLPGRFDDVPDALGLLDLKGGRIPHVEMLGVARLDSLPIMERESLKRLMPDARSLIVAGASLPRRVVELAGAQEAECGVSYQYVNYQALREAFWTAQDIASSLARAGHHAEALIEVDERSVGQKNHYVGTLPDLRAQAPFAAAAGLGFIGRNGFLISPKYGPRQRFAFVLTSAELPASAPLKGACPEGCRACADACPVKALDASAQPVFKRDEARCEWARVMGMVEAEGALLTGWTQEELPVPEKLDEAVRKRALEVKDPIAVRCYQDPNRAETTVERCLQACPFGKTP